MSTQPVVKLTLDYSANYLLPLDTAAKVVELLATAKIVEHGSHTVNGKHVTYDVVQPKAPFFAIAAACDDLIAQDDYDAFKGIVRTEAA